MAVSNKRYVWQTGKNLFEILNQLPNFGVGRIVTLGRWQHFTPERPSYYKITRVKLDCSKENLNHGEAWGVPTIKGYSKDGLEVKIKEWHLNEWKLIRKSEEEDFCSYTPKAEDFKQVPKYVRMPPLLEELVYQEKKAKGEDVSKPIALPKRLVQDFDSEIYFMEDDDTISDYGKENVDIDNVGDLTETIKFLEDFKKPIKKWDWEDIWKSMQKEEN
ncbi:small ribosomal subunit protein mS34-like [Apostichopus japonicus]|uniref:small ribosomal subunit protein mS34-like n=1 Tax=Stichopus japonicus TaxID=307972 RepID=UPI003AB80437